MKKMNLLVMSLVSAAALSFSSCSSNDDLGGGNNGGQTQVEGFYMKLTVQTPTSNGTRTVEKNEYNATEAESKVTSGTFYLTDANNSVIFKKAMTEQDWENNLVPAQSTKGSATLVIPTITNVTPGVTYKVYFLANTIDDNPWTHTFTAGSPFSADYSKANNFAMFNQNDADVKANSYDVEFTKDNMDKSNPAKIKDGKAIKIERIVARIDQPTSVETITDYTTTMSENEIKALTQAQKTAMEEAKAKIASLKLTKYAISNLAKTTNIMQSWNEGFTHLNIPTTEYWNPTSNFGTVTNKQNADNLFKEIKEEAKKAENWEYVFENNVEGKTNATSMYLEYQVTLNKEKFTNYDCLDGTFFRYNNKIYTSIKDIYDDTTNGTNPFEGAPAVDELLAKLKITDGKITAIEDELDAFRTQYGISVFVEGKVYYSTTINDQYFTEENHNVIQRNSVYQLNVKNILRVGADVPNGNKEDDDPLKYYLNVEVSVNPWVLNSQNVELK